MKQWFTRLTHSGLVFAALYHWQRRLCIKASLLLIGAIIALLLVLSGCTPY